MTAAEYWVLPLVITWPQESWVLPLVITWLTGGEAIAQLCKSIKPELLSQEKPGLNIL